MAKLNKYRLTINDFSMFRPSQTIIEGVVIQAHSAEDALTIAKIRHNVPFRSEREVGCKLYPAKDICVRTVINIEVVE